MKSILFVLLLPVCAAVKAAEHRVLPSDTLWSLAGRYYGDPFQWRAIAQANPSVKDPHWIYPGQVLLIPELQRAAPAPAETAAAVAPPAAQPEEAPPQPAPRAQEAAPPQAAAAPAAPPKPELPPQDSLSVELPQALSGQYPSMTRLKAPAGWSQDGEVTEYDGTEALAAAGDFVNGRFKKVVPALGETLYVLRDEAAEELDEDKEARYLVRVGSARVEKSLGKGVYRLLILQSGDSVQVGDHLSRKKL